jgi:hypothetical protein
MKRELILILILFASFACAKDITLYNNWVKAGEPFSIGNDTFLVNYILESNTTLIRFPEGISGAIYASTGSCTNEWLYSVCQRGQKFQVNGKDVPPDIRSGGLDVSLFLMINKTDAGLTLEREILPSVFFLGDIITAKARIEKIGSPTVFNVSFIDIYPGFYVQSLSSVCKAEGNKLSFEDTSFNTPITCIYTLTPRFEMNSNNTATLSYVVLDKQISKTHNQNLVVLESPITLDLSYNKSQPLQSETYFKIKIDSNEKATPKELIVTFPTTFLKIDASPEFNSANNILRLQNPKSLVYFFVLQSNFSGNYTLNVSVNYDYNNFLQQAKKSYPIEITKKSFLVSVFKQENGSIIRLSNTEKLAFKNIRLFAGETSFWMPILEKNRYKEFFVPLLDNKTYLGVVYQTEFGQFFNDSFPLTYSTYTLPGQTRAEEDEKTQRKGIDFSNFKVIVPKEVILVCFGVLFLGLVVVFIRSRPEKSKLDKEIEELKKEDQEKKLN